MTMLHGQPINIGDRAWTTSHGWGVVTEIVTDSSYQITIHDHSYTQEGKHYSSDMCPSLFWQEVVIPPETLIKPLPQLEVDAKVIVWDGGVEREHKRHFSHFLDNGNICCFDSGATSWAYKCTNEWDNWELYKEEETK